LNEVAQITNDLREVLAHIREDPGGGRRHSRHQRDDKKFDASKFNGSLNLDSYLKWVQSIKRFFHVKEYSDEKAFKVVVHKLERYPLFWYGSTKKQRVGDGKCKIRRGLSLRDSWINDS